MRRTLLALLAALSSSTAFAQTVEKPTAIIVDGVPAVPTELATATRPYMEYRTATFLGWHPNDKSMLIATRFGNTQQLHRVANPMGARTQITFYPEPINGALTHPKNNGFLFAKDSGGNEFFQFHDLAPEVLG